RNAAVSQRNAIIMACSFWMPSKLTLVSLYALPRRMVSFRTCFPWKHGLKALCPIVRQSTKNARGEGAKFEKGLLFKLATFVIGVNGSVALVAFDEMHPADSGLRQPYAGYENWFASQDPARLTEKMQDAERVFRRTGITFAVYGEQEAA